MGSAHPDTLNSVHNMAILRYEMGEHTAAPTLMQEALARYQRVLGEDRGLTEGATLNSMLDDLKKKDRDSKDRIEIENRLARIAELAKTGETTSITLPETRRQTLQNNLSIQAVLLDPAIAKQAVRLQQAKFESTFNLSVTQTRTVGPQCVPSKNNPRTTFD